MLCNNFLLDKFLCLWVKLLKTQDVLKGGEMFHSAWETCYVQGVKNSKGSGSSWNWEDLLGSFLSKHTYAVRTTEGLSKQLNHLKGKPIELTNRVSDKLGCLEGAQTSWATWRRHALTYWGNCKLRSEPKVFCFHKLSPMLRWVLVTKLSMSHFCSCQ